MCSTCTFISCKMMIDLREGYQREKGGNPMKLVIFQMDGTTVDMLDSVVYFANKALKEAGLSELGTNRYTKLLDDNLHLRLDCCAKEAGAYGMCGETFKRRYWEAYSANPHLLLKPYGCITELLATLKTMGLHTAIVSDRPQHSAGQLSDKFFGDLVDRTYGITDDVPQESESTRLLRVVSHFRVKKEECLYVGSTAANIAAGKKAGLYTIGVSWGVRRWSEMTGDGADLLTGRVDEIIRAASVDCVDCFTRPGYIPPYWEKHLEAKIRKVQENQRQAGKKALSFGMISDIHWQEGRPSFCAALLAKAADACGVAYVFNGGDTVSGMGLCGPDRLTSELTDYHSHFQSLEPRMLMAQGNHDGAYSEFEAPRYYAQNLTKAELYTHIFAYETAYPDRIMSPDGSYFYADSEPHKTRFVVLNPYDVPSDEVQADGGAKYNKMWLAGYRQTQLEWFAEEALCVPDNDWTVVLCTHQNPVTGQPYPGECCRNEDVVLKIIDAYRNGLPYELTRAFADIPEYSISLKGSFAGRGGEFAIWLSGHTHIDRELVIDGTLCVSIISDFNDQHEDLAFARKYGTVTEHAFDIYTIDFARHKLYATRFGAGEDRVFDYSSNRKT